ncbi:MAG: polysaccharide biosynthesis/export family protein [Coxiellaceae bacterium]|nr:polysaccharide biosynthesis/export family protein [Coxiellaceae bacterium]
MKYRQGIIAKSLCLSSMAALLSGCFMAPGQHYIMRPLNNPGPAVAAPVKLVRLDYNLPHKNPALFQPYAYRVGPEDILNITVWDHPELTIPAGQFRSAEESGIEVSAKGDVFYPFAGRFSVLGLTVKEISEKLTLRLRSYIRSPQVSVRVAGYNSQKIQVLGSVRTPRTIEVHSAPISVMDAVSTAGGFDPLAANTAFVYIIRPLKPFPTVYTFNADDPTAVLIAGSFFVRPRDVIYVSTAGIVNWGRFINNLLPSFTTAITAAAVAN